MQDRVLELRLHTRCGALRSLWTAATWLIRGKEQLKVCTGGRGGSGKFVVYTKGSVSLRYWTLQVSAIATRTTTDPPTDWAERESERETRADENKKLDSLLLLSRLDRQQTFAALLPVSRPTTTTHTSLLCLQFLCLQRLCCRLITSLYFRSAPLTAYLKGKERQYCLVSTSGKHW